MAFSKLRFMKITKTLYLVIFITLINVSSVVAAKNPPPPVSASRSMADDPEVPPPPGAAIDQNLIILLVGALGFGTYTIFRYKDIKKASM